MDIRYTQYLGKQAESFDTSDDNFEYEDVLIFLNDVESFAPFGERLERFLNENGLSKQENPAAFLRKSFENHGIAIARNTVNNWFKVNGPKKGDTGRESILQLAFALDLNSEQTNILLNKVYLDRKIDCRNPKEFIMLYCLDNELSWETAQMMIRQYSLQEKEQDGTISTQGLSDVQQTLESKEDVLEYIKTHPHNFRLRYRSAVEIRNRLLNKVQGTGNGDGEIDKEYAEQMKKAFYSDEMYKGKHSKTNEQMIRVIVGPEIAVLSDSKRRSYFKNSFLPKEITNRFPEATEFSKEPSYEQLRKMIILLASYLCWRGSGKLSGIGKKKRFELYRDDIDNRLREAGFAPLYYGNPYDWLFLFSASQDDPLRVFREVLAEAISWEE